MSGKDDEQARSRAKRRIDFDDPISGRSKDDTDAGWGEDRSEGSQRRDLDWYLRETPPHHGDK
jgi:hypothetical protein